MYSSKVVVPGNVDLLVAGTCCVDFSNLNGNRLNLEQMGESGRTFFATLQYMVEYLPKIVIFENVLTAPWTTKITKDGKKPGLDYHIGLAGYATRFIKLDTKKFYLPHTRLRGYMICINKAHAYTSFCDEAKTEPTEKDLDDFAHPETGGLNVLFDFWEKLVEYLGCDASVGVDAMLLAADDPRLFSLRDGESEGKSRKAIPWEKCKVGHHEYRSAYGFGSKHAITDWHDDIYKLPDYFHRNVKGLTQRVLDTIDIAHLRNLKRGFDDRFYRLVFSSICVRNLANVVIVAASSNCHRMCFGCATPREMALSAVSRLLDFHSALFEDGESTVWRLWHCKVWIQSN